MEHDGAPAVREIIFRIMNRAPYHPIAGFSVITSKGRSVGRIRDEISTKTGVEKRDIVIRVLKRFKTEERTTKEWLNLNRLYDTQGKRLDRVEKYKRQIEYFKEAQRVPYDPLWLYTTNKRERKKLAEALPEICDILGCDQKDIERYGNRPVAQSD